MRTRLAAARGRRGGFTFALLLAAAAAQAAPMAGAELVLQESHAGKILGAAVREDGTIASWDSAGTVKFWDSRLGLLASTLRSEGLAPTGRGAWSGDSLRLARADGSLLVARPEGRLEAEPGPARGAALALSASATLSWEGGRLLLDRAGALPSLLGAGPAEEGAPLACADEGGFFVAYRGSVAVFSPEGRAGPVSPAPWGPRFRPLVMSASRGILAIGASDACVYLRAPGAAAFSKLRGLVGDPLSVAVGEGLVHATDAEGSLLSWRLADGALVEELRGSGFELVAARGRLVALTRAEGTVAAREGIDGGTLRSMGRRIDRPSRAFPGPDGSLAFVGDGLLQRFIPAGMAFAEGLRFPGLVDADWDPAAKAFCLVQAKGGAGYRFEARDAGLRASLMGFDFESGGGRPSSLRSSGGRFLLMLGGMDSGYGRWLAGSWRGEAFGLPLTAAGASRSAASPDLSLLALGDRLVPWSAIESEAELERLPRTGGLAPFAISADGSRAFAASGSRLFVHDAAGALLRRVELGGAFVSGCLSPDGKEVWAAEEGGWFERLGLDGSALGRGKLLGSGLSSISAFYAYGVPCLAGIGQGGELAIANPATGGLAYLVSSGDQWVIATPDGYWDGSRDAAGLVAVKAGGRLFNIDQFAVRNNRPDLVAERLGAPAALVAEFRLAYRRRLARMGVSEPGLAASYEIPEARIVAHRVEGREAELSLAFSSPRRALARYQLFVNDVPLLGAGGKPVSGLRAEASERLTLCPGANKIEVSCMDAGGAESYRAPLALRWAGSSKPDLYFLGFGVSKYRDPRLDLGYAAKDAQDLAALFSSMEGKGFGAVHARAYLDAQATSKAIAEAKKALAGARPEDVFVLFISGHGLHDRDARRTYYYLTHDTDLRNLAGTAANFEELEELLNGIAPRQKLFLMDTCASGEEEEGQQQKQGQGQGQAQQGQAAGRGARPRSIDGGRGMGVLASPSSASRKDRFIFNDLVRRSGAIVFSSCRGSEYSYEFPEIENGAFTSAIKRAFAGAAADRDRDGTVSVDELRAYVSALVPEIVSSRDPSWSQHPTVDRDNLYIRFGFPVSR